MTPHHLAQINVGRLRAPIDSPLIAPFVEALARINALAEGQPGFVWRLTGDGGDATDIRAYEDGLYKYLDSAQGALVADLTQKKQIDDDIRARLHAALKEYTANFKADVEAAVATK